MKHLLIAAAMLAACSAGGPGPDIFTRTSVDEVDAGSELIEGRWDDPSGDWPVDDLAGDDRPVFFRESLLSVDGPATLIEDSTGARYVYDDHRQPVTQKFSFPEFLGQRRSGSTHFQTTCQIKEGFINLGFDECLLPSPNATYKWRIHQDMTGDAEYVAAARAVVAYYRDSLGVPFVEVSGTDDSYYVSFEGYRDFGGAVVGTTIFDTLAGSVVVTTAAGGQRGIGRYRGRNRIFVDETIQLSKTQLEGALCHETGHSVGVAHPTTASAFSCMYSVNNGIQLKSSERNRLLAVVNGTQGGVVILPAVPGDTGN